MLRASACHPCSRRLLLAMVFVAALQLAGCTRAVDIELSAEGANREAATAISLS